MAPDRLSPLIGTAVGFAMCGKNYLYYPVTETGHKREISQLTGRLVTPV